jgi:hypothetical protein
MICLRRLVIHISEAAAGALDWRLEPMITARYVTSTDPSPLHPTYDARLIHDWHSSQLQISKISTSF